MEAERLRAQAEKQRGDDLSKIAMMLAAGKDKDKDAGEVIPQSPPTGAADKSPSNDTASKSPSKQEGLVARHARVYQGVVTQRLRCFHSSPVL